MYGAIQKDEVKKLIGRRIYAVKKDGTLVSGKLIRVSGQKLVLQPDGGKNVRTSAVIPLVLFDLLAIGTSPFAYGPYAFGPFSPYGFWGFDGLPFFW
jgi:hypothetical protein